eukprot:10068-Eustigmatos_ZCMA.PRE.1
MTPYDSTVRYKYHRRGSALIRFQSQGPELQCAILTKTVYVLLGTFRQQHKLRALSIKSSSEPHTYAAYTAYLSSSRLST